MKRLLVVVALLAAACGGSPAAPSTPPPPPIAACVSQNTADVTLVNASPSQATYDVLIDNVKKGTLSPGQSATYTVVAGVSHAIVSQFTNTTLAACSSTPSFVQCSSQSLTCRG